MPYPLGMFTKVGLGRDGVRHNKFWECLDAQDGSFRVRWGPIGSEGRTQRVNASEAQKRIDAKERDSYIHASGSFTKLQEKVAAEIAAVLPPAPSVRRARF